MRYSECLFVLFVMKMKRNWKQIVVIGFGYRYFYRSNRMYKEGCVFPMLISSELSMGKTYPTLLGLVASLAFQS